MIDSGALTQLINPEFANQLGLKLDLKPVPEALIVVDGSKATAPLMHTYTLDLMLDQHLETLTFQVTKLAGWQLIVGKTWLKGITLLLIGSRTQLLSPLDIVKHIACPPGTFGLNLLIRPTLSPTLLTQTHIKSQ